ncbi:MAG: ABC transporter ATP-binding protein [Candidatus Bathyarchaeota archaeon]|nr:ABC transporter ATP-binding protein [Candidatus Bathyarchaeota archaeon]
MTEERLLEINGLVLNFYTYEGIVQALDGVNLYIRDGETLGLVGETGCGKSVTSLSTLVLIPSPGKIEGGRILFNVQGKKVDLLKQSDEHLRTIRGKDISMVFQEPRVYLNPVYTVSSQISEVLVKHRKEEFLKKALESLKQERRKKGLKGSTFEMNLYERMLKNPNSLTNKILSKIPGSQRRFKLEVQREVVRILRGMGIPDPERVAKMYPHELSGGMAQRVVIAMALACNPKLLIADEPTTNLDVTVQAQILSLIKRLKSMFKSSVLYITHDLGVISEISDRVAVMYAGNVVELADVYELFKKPLHPYTRGLLESIPRPGKPLKSIPGTVPSLLNPPSGCRFHDRCSYAMEICRKVKPAFTEVEKDHFVACNLYGGSK